VEPQHTRGPVASGPMRTMRVLIVDDHAMVAEGLAEVLGAEPGIEVVGRAGTVRDARRLAAETVPDVVVMDYRLPDGDGAEAARRIREEHPATAVVMVTASDHDTVIAAAIEAGCAAYVTKDRAAQDVVAAVRAAARGEVAFPASALARMIPRMRGATAGPKSGALTPREREILQFLADGRSTKDIAADLVLSPSTVRNHVQNILGKLDAHSKLEAVTTAVRQGIVTYRD
jgi:DNA-binding NarL/FixJ family response regulator